MSTTPYIPIVLGTAREGRRSENVANFVFSILGEHNDIEVELVDIRDHIYDKTLPAWEEHEETAGWKTIASRADGFLLVVPEYNHGYPGELKQLLDSAYDEYAHKPVALAGVSTGSFGGARVVDLIKPTLVELKMTVLRDALYFPKVGDLFNDDGKMDATKKEKQQDRVNDIADTLAVYATGMRDIRKKLT